MRQHKCRLFCVLGALAKASKEISTEWYGLYFAFGNFVGVPTVIYNDSNDKETVIAVLKQFKETLIERPVDVSK